MSEIRVFTDMRDEGLAAAWEGLFKEVGRCPQNGYHWNAAWWNHFGGPGRSPLIITLWRGPECTALAPFMIERSLGFSRIRFLGAGLTDYHDILCRDEEAPENVAALFLEHLRKENLADLMQFEQIPEHSAMAGGLAGLPGGSRRRCSECPAVEFAGRSWEEFLYGLKSGVRQNWRRRLRHLEDEGEVGFSVKTELSEKLSVLQRIFQIHVKRWAAEGAESKLRIPQVQGFIRDVLMTVEGSSIHTLTLDGVLIAYRIGLERSDTFYDWNNSFDPDFKEQSAGFVLLGLSLRHLCERGIKTYDFMRGNYHYKRDWTNGEPIRANWEFFFPMTWPRGNLGAAYYSDWKWRIKKVVYPILEMRTAQRLRQRLALGLNRVKSEPPC